MRNYRGLHELLALHKGNYSADHTLNGVRNIMWLDKWVDIPFKVWHEQTQTMTPPLWDKIWAVAWEQLRHWHWHPVSTKIKNEDKSCWSWDEGWRHKNTQSTHVHFTQWLYEHPCRNTDTCKKSKTSLVGHGLKDEGIKTFHTGGLFTKAHYVCTSVVRMKLGSKSMQLWWVL